MKKDYSNEVTVKIDNERQKRKKKDVLYKPMSVTN